MENKPSTPENEYPSKLESKVSQKDDNSDDFLFVSHIDIKMYSALLRFNSFKTLRREE